MEKENTNQMDLKTHLSVPHAFIKNWLADLNKAELAVILLRMQRVQVEERNLVCIPFARLSTMTGTRVQSLRRCLDNMESTGLLTIHKDGQVTNQFPKNLYTVNYEIVHSGTQRLADPGYDLDRATVSERRKWLLADRQDDQAASTVVKF